MTLIDALNNPELRCEIDAVDDIWSSLDRGDRDEPTLWSILDIAVKSLAEKGVTYDPRA